MKSIIFIGGVHGAGKNFLLESIKLDIPFIHLTASKVLKWKEISDILLLLHWILPFLIL